MAGVVGIIRGSVRQWCCDVDCHWGDEGWLYTEVLVSVAGSGVEVVQLLSKVSIHSIPWNAIVSSDNFFKWFTVKQKKQSRLIICLYNFPSPPCNFQRGDKSYKSLQNKKVRVIYLVAWGDFYDSVWAKCVVVELVGSVTEVCTVAPKTLLNIIHCTIMTTLISNTKDEAIF